MDDDVITVVSLVVPARLVGCGGIGSSLFASLLYSPP